MAMRLSSFDEYVSKGWIPVFPVWIDHGVVFKKGKEYRAMLLTSFDKMISEGWTPLFEVLLDNGVAFRK